MLPTLSSLPLPQPLQTLAPPATSLEKPPTIPPSSLQNLYMSNYLMAISSVPLALLPLIGPAYHAVPHRLMSFPNLTHTPSFQLASFATLIALQFRQTQRHYHMQQLLHPSRNLPTQWTLEPTTPLPTTTGQCPHTHQHTKRPCRMAPCCCLQP